MTMQKFRKNVKLFLWVVVAGFILWIFVQLGANIVGRRRHKPWEEGIIAEIDEEKVPYSVYNQMLSKDLQDSVEAHGGRELSDEEINRIEDAVWKRMVEDVAWRKVVEKRNLKLRDETIAQVLLYSPPPEVRKYFEDSTGKFDFQRYRQALANPQNLPFFKPYEIQYAQQLPREVMRIDAFQSVMESDEEAWLEFKKQNEKVRILYMTITVPDSLTNPTEENLKKFYEENPDSFKSPPRVNLAYVVINKLPSHDDTMEMYDRIMLAYNQIKELNIPFDSIAAQYSEDDLSRDKGGDLGWVYPSRGNPSYFKYFQLYNELKKRIDSGQLQLGEVTEPILTNQGWHIAEVVDTSDDSLHIKHILLKIKTSVKTKEEARALAQELADSAKKYGLEEAAKKLGLEAKETGLFKLTLNFVPYFGRDDELLEFAKNGKKGDLTGVLRRPRFYLVAEIKEKRPEEVPPFDEIKGSVKNKYLIVKKREMGKKYADEIYEKLKSGKDFTEVAAEYPQLEISVDTSMYFTRNQAVPKIPFKSEIYGMAFTLPVGQVSKPIFVGRNYYIIKVLDRQEPSRDDFARQKENLKKRRVQQIAFRLWTNFQKEIVDNVKVKDYRSRVLY